jgi:voltage-gated potassium channel
VSERVHLPRSGTSAWRKLALRLAFAVSLILFVAVVCFVGREGYRDGDAVGGLSALDALYYASVSVTTTGYGDITPVTDATRLVTVLLVTPARILFLILLVGTTVELLTTQTLRRLRHDRWRRTLRDHIVICGFGTKGRVAAQTLVDQGADRSSIVVVEAGEERLRDAREAGYAVVHGDAAHAPVLLAAGIAEAARVVVAVARDDAAVLITLTAREHNADASIVAAVREDDNAHLLHQSGATAVVRTASAAGRMLGLGSRSPQLVDVLEDLTTIGQGVDLVDRPVEASECGEAGTTKKGTSVIAVVRDGETFRWDDPQVAVLQEGDRLVCLQSNR